MVIGIDMGHTVRGAGTGAVGCGYKEHEINRTLGKKIIELLRKEKHTVIDITVDESASQINDRVYKANKQHLDMLVSLHFNAGGGTGVEVLTYDNKTLQTESKRVCENIAKLGFRNRGIKIRTNLGILANTRAKAMLIEVCFIDNKSDMDLYNKNVDNVAKGIVEGLLGKTITPPVTTPPTPNKNVIKIKIDGKVYDMEGVLIDGSNYLKVRELEKAGYKIGFEGSMAIINKP